MKTIYIVKGEVTCLEAHPTAQLGDTEWQFSDGPPSKRGSSADYLSLEEGLKAQGPAIFYFWDPLYETRAALGQLLDQVYQMEGMFLNDQALQDAIKDAEDFLNA